MSSEKISRNVVIANRSYPLKIYKSDEQKILDAVHKINEKVDLLKGKYAAKDNQDYLAMCLLQIVTQDSQKLNSSNAQTLHDSSSNTDFEEFVTSLESELSDIEF